MSEDFHIPNPEGEYWTDEQRKHFLPFTQGCPMCQYKLKYHDLKQLMLEILPQTTDGSVQQDAVVNQIGLMDNELRELGLFIAHEQCVANARAREGLYN